MNANDQVVLYVSKERDAAIPMSTAALRTGQGKLRTLRSRNVGGLLVERSGKVSRIVDIGVVGYYGDGFLRKALSFATDAYVIDTRLQDEPLALDQIKQLLLPAIAADEQRGEPYLDGIADFDIAKDRLQAADSVEEIFSILRVSQGEGALDVMC